MDGAARLAVQRAVRRLLRRRRIDCRRHRRGRRRLPAAGPATVDRRSYDAFTYHIGGVLGALIGAVIGLAIGVFAGLFAPLLLAGGLDPIDILVRLVQIFVALIIAVTYPLYGVRFEKKRLELTGAHQPSRREAELVKPVLDDCAARLGCAQIGIAGCDDATQGHGHTRHVVVSTGLLEEAAGEPDPIGGVLYAPIGALREWRRRGATVCQGFGAAAVPELFGAQRHPWNGRPHIRAGSGVVVLWPIMFSVRQVLIPIQAHDYRRSEYRADRGAGHRRHRDRDSDRAGQADEVRRQPERLGRGRLREGAVLRAPPGPARGPGGSGTTCHTGPMQPLRPRTASTSPWQRTDDGPARHWRDGARRSQPHG